MNAYELVHAFQNQSKDFVLGWEAHTFWGMMETMSRVGAVYMDTLHASNEGECLRIAQHFGFRRTQWEAIPDNPDFVNATFKRVGA